MQRKADNNGILSTPGSSNDIYAGAFAYTSPPERLLLSDTTNNQDVSPFTSRYTVLKFNSENKNNQGKKGVKSNKSTSSNGAKNFNFKNKTGKLLDLKIEDQVLGKGIFSSNKNENDMLKQGAADLRQDNFPVGMGTGTSTNTSFSNSNIDEHPSQNPSFIPTAKFANKENPLILEDDFSCYTRTHSNTCYEFRRPAPIANFNRSNPFQGIGGDEDGQSILPQKKTRKIAKIPYKVLDAPQLRDDFYLNLVDWSDSNNLAVALS